MRKKITLILFLLFTSCSILLAQVNTIKGKVTDETGQILPGVTVKANGTPNTTVTDVNGSYSIKVPPNATLSFSFIGYATQNVQVGSENTINVKMSVVQNNLNEVVVVGYGTQKKSVTTGAISSVGAAQLENQPINRVEQALQGRTSGLTIQQNSGQPGSSSTIRIRGYSTFSNTGSNDPLWIVDGVIVDNGGVGYLNENDIESIQVLKDAASAAIYGTRAANGVILVSTKKGKAGSIRVNYNGFYGTSAPAHKLDLLNAQQYVTIRNESALNAGKAAPFGNPSTYGQGTDWQSLIFSNNARRQTHEVNISGGSDKATFFTSVSYITQQGIVAKAISNWNRATIRLNSTYNVNKYITVGENLGYSHSVNSSLGNTNSEFGGPLSDAINLDPLTPAVETDPTKYNAAPYSTQPTAVRNAQGLPYGISSQVGQEIVNPLAYIQNRIGNYGYDHNIVGNAFLTIEPIKNLKFNSTIGTKLAFYGSESYSPQFYLNSSTTNTRTNAYREMNLTLNYNFENTLSYSKTIGKHFASLLVGQGNYMDNNTRQANVNFYNVIAQNFFQQNFNYKPVTGDIVGGASDGTRHKIASLFARATYNYNEKYLLTGVVRRDGSSRFGANYKYGVFPGFSAGWVPTLEDFFPKNNTLNFLKIRGGYGVVGNDAIGDFAYVSTVGSNPTRSYTYGTTDASTIGFSPNAPSNPNLHWEETRSTDLGFESTWFNDFTLAVDLFRKKTVGILYQPPIPAYLGYAGSAYQNYGDILNKGIEFELGYNKRIGDFRISANANASFLKNTILSIAPGQNFVENQAGTFQNLGNITRSTVGGSYNAFYGYNMLGIFQSQAEIDAYTHNGVKIQPNAVPGDVKFLDANNDGKITADDRSNIGQSIPKMTYGLTLNLSYKNWDLVAFGNGQAGSKIFQGLHRLDITNANYSTSILNRWTPSNPSTTQPRVSDTDPNRNYLNFSRLFLESGNFFRVKTLQIGYTIPQRISGKIGLNKLRVYVLSENLATITKYDGYDPEAGGNTFGIDKGVYPQARSFMLGVNVGF